MCVPLYYCASSLSNRGDSNSSFQLKTANPKKFDSKVPRVYPSYKPLSSQDEVHLTFERPLYERSSKPLLFLATATVDNSKALLVVNDRYGAHVHQILGQRGLAPTLYGHRHLEGAATAYVMDYLASPTTSPPSEGWKTLHDFAKSQGVVKYKNDVCTIS
ncbi:hypothetical protein FRC03_006985 [Tulasnella sp. 419]|nr:hypothetical protein FRC03_006985 [Tulasnella sp. 419]